jgi:mannonate dehydratase
MGKATPPFRMEQMMRWFGPADPVRLKDILQAGCSGAVSSLHHILPGEVWTIDEIEAYKRHFIKCGLDWTVVESLPVHEGIKSGNGNASQWIENYKESLRNLAACGIKVVTYNFMPVLDWVRTDIYRKNPDGSRTLSINMKDFLVFDRHILKRPGAWDGLGSAEMELLDAYYHSLSLKVRGKISFSVMQGLPGSKEYFTTSRIHELLELYSDIDDARLRKNLVGFLREIAPVADQVGIRLAIHPDDPPFPVLGLPRVMSTADDIRQLMEAVPNDSNGLCFCTGSFGVRRDNDLVQMIREWGSRIHFLHLRNTIAHAEGNFMEASHFEGDTDMYAVVEEVVRLMHGEGRSIPMRPDHGLKILDDLKKDTYPGYSAIGRLKGLAELRGLEYAIQQNAGY